MSLTGDEKFDKFYEEVYEAQDKPHAASYGSIQWKGTDVCIDLFCKCGASGHIDGDFFYHYKCSACGSKYAVATHVNLIELTDVQSEYAETRIGFYEDKED